jgi:hypothetical protein
MVPRDWLAHKGKNKNLEMRLNFCLSVIYIFSAVENVPAKIRSKIRRISEIAEIYAKSSKEKIIQKKLNSLTQNLTHCIA